MPNQTLAYKGRILCGLAILQGQRKTKVRVHLYHKDSKDSGAVLAMHPCVIVCQPTHLSENKRCLQTWLNLELKILVLVMFALSQCLPALATPLSLSLGHWLPALFDCLLQP